MENIHCYILVNQSFKDENEGLKSGANELKTATTNDGRIVISANTLNDFPELFIERSRLTPLFLTTEDFPPSENEQNL